MSNTYYISNKPTTRQKQWSVHFSTKRKLFYYYNIRTKVSSWEKPPDLKDDDILDASEVTSLPRPTVVTEVVLDPHVIDNVGPICPKKLATKKLRESDSGVIDLYNDLVNDSDGEHDRGTSEEVTPVVYGPAAPTEKTGRIIYTDKERTRAKNKSLRDLRNKSKDDRMYSQFLSGSVHPRQQYRAKFKQRKRQRDVKNDKEFVQPKHFDRRSAPKVRQDPPSKIPKESKIFIPQTDVKKTVINSAPVKTSVESSSGCEADLSPSATSLSPLHSYSSGDEASGSSGCSKRKRLKTSTKMLPPALAAKPAESVKSVQPKPLTDIVKNDQTNESRFEEEMEWEESPYLERDILRDIGEVRKELASSPNQETELSLMDVEYDENVLSSNIQNTFVVFDTNVLISNLKLIKNIIDVILPDESRIVVVVPWQVLQELDRLKTKSSGFLANQCRNVISYICGCFLTKHPRIIGQSAKHHGMRFDYMSCEVPDDAILCCCLQLMEQNEKVILCTNDKNLVVKASANNIKAYTDRTLSIEYSDSLKHLAENPEIRFKGANPDNCYNNPRKKPNDLFESNVPLQFENNFSNFHPGQSKQRHPGSVGSDFNSVSVSDRTSCSSVVRKMSAHETVGKMNSRTSSVESRDRLCSPESEKYLSPAPQRSSQISDSKDDLMIRFQQQTNKFLLNVLKSGMKCQYSNNWCKHVVKKPPWTIEDLFFCVSHHWFAITGKFLPDWIKRTIKSIRSKFGSHSVVRYTGSDLQSMIEKSYVICSELQNLYPDFVQDYFKVLSELESSMCKDDGDDNGVAKGCFDSAQGGSVNTSFNHSFFDDNSYSISGHEIMLNTIKTTWNTIAVQCCNLGNGLGIKEIAEAYDFKANGEQSLPLQVLIEKKLPSMNSFLNEFVGSARRVLKVKKFGLSINNPDIVQIFLSLSGFLDVCDPEFSINLVLNFVEQKREEFEDIVNDFNRLKCHLAKCTSVISVQKCDSTTSNTFSGPPSKRRLIHRS